MLGWLLRHAVQLGDAVCPPEAVHKIIRSLITGSTVLAAHGAEPVARSIVGQGSRHQEDEAHHGSREASHDAAERLQRESRSIASLRLEARRISVGKREEEKMDEGSDGE